MAPAPAVSDALGDAKATALRLIGMLPQAALIPVEHRRLYVDRIFEAAAERGDNPFWHIKRLTGIGGSEIGSLLLWSRGGFHPFKTARELVAEKLLIALPGEDTDDTRRGRRAEATIRQLFYEKTGARRDDAAFEVLRRKDPENPWQVGNPDDIVIMPDGRRLIPDYKAPRPHNCADYVVNGAPFDYVVQTHHYGLMATRRGVPIDGRLVVAFDSLRWDIEMLEVEHDPELDREILEVGQRVWRDHVLTGVLPAMAKRQVVELPSPVPDDIASQADDYIAYRAVASTAEKAAKDLQTKCNEWLNTLGRLDPKKDARLGVLTVKVTDASDVGHLVERLRDFGGDPDAFARAGDVDAAAAVVELGRLVERASLLSAGGAAAPDVEQFVREVAAVEMPRLPGGYDVDALAQALRDLGGDPEPHLKQELAVTLPKGKNSAEAQVWLGMKELAEPQVHVLRGHLMDAMTAQVDQEVVPGL